MLLRRLDLFCFSETSKMFESSLQFFLVQTPTAAQSCTGKTKLVTFASSFAFYLASTCGQLLATLCYW